jgi:hypothetical protein
MTYLIFGILGAAGLLFGPRLARQAAPALGPAPAPPHLTPTYQSAIADLAHVRLRLIQTEKLDDGAKKAIDTLTLALVAGSDHP